MKSLHSIPAEKDIQPLTERQQRLAARLRSFGWWKVAVHPETNTALLTLGSETMKTNLRGVTPLEPGAFESLWNVRDNWLVILDEEPDEPNPPEEEEEYDDDYDYGYEEDEDEDD